MATAIHGHGDHDHGDHKDAGTKTTLAFDNVGEDHNHDNHHLCCQDDGCSLIKTVKYKFTSLNCATRYLGGAEDYAILSAVFTNFSLDSIPDCRAFTQRVRAHLLFSVQLI